MHYTLYQYRRNTRKSYFIPSNTALVRKRSPVQIRLSAPAASCRSQYRNLRWWVAIFLLPDTEIHFVTLHHVAASCISLAATFYQSHRRAHSAVSPFPKKVTLCLCCLRASAFAILWLATSLFREHKDSDSPVKMQKIVKNRFHIARLGK